MRITLLCTILFVVAGPKNLLGQCDFITPPAVKKISYASREVTFSDVTMNGKKTTYLSVKKGASIQITTNLESKKKGDYCPSCIVQVYWGIRGHTSVCAKSFYGYQFDRIKSTHKFAAPMEDGIYYITMGGTLDYSCKNNKYRPTCPAEDAFAVLKVGKPDPEKKITLVKVKKGTGSFMKTTLIKQGCFGDLDKIEWFLDGEKLAYDNQQEIPLTKTGNYKVMWSNCLGSIADSLTHNSNEKKAPLIMMQSTSPIESQAKKKTPMIMVQGKKIIDPKENEQTPIISEGDSSVPESTDIEVLVENNDNFVLENLIFDLGRSEIRPEAKEDLNMLAEIMKDKPSMKILLEGHTDYRGSAKKNQILSEDRVKSTKEYLIQQGCNGENIETKGWGHQKPLIVTKDIEEGKINRRVEIRILSR